MKKKNDLGQKTMQQALQSAVDHARSNKVGIHGTRELLDYYGDRSPEALRAFNKAIKHAIETGAIHPQRFPSVAAKVGNRRYSSQLAQHKGIASVGGVPEHEFIPPRAITILSSTVRKKTQLLRDHLAEAIATHLEPPFTVRNCYYALVSLFGNHYPKSDATYTKVKTQLVALRRLGVIRHADIIDTSRRYLAYQTHESIQEILDRSARIYNPDIWNDQSVLIQVWSEKDTVSGLLDRVIQRYQVPLFVARGFGSESFISRAANMIKRQQKPVKLLYVGDHDPSGCYMPAALVGGLKRLLGDDANLLEYRRLAVLPSQAVGDLARFGHAPNKADTRYPQFTKLFGSDAQAVELDAIRPQQVRQLLQSAIAELLPHDWTSQYQDKERDGRQCIERMAVDAWGADLIKERGLLNFMGVMNEVHEDDLIHLMRKQAEETAEAELDELDDIFIDD